MLPCAPDFNPIEMLWAWIKKRLRKLGPRDNAARAKAVDQAFADVPATLAADCFKHCNYLPIITLQSFPILAEDKVSSLKFRPAARFLRG